MDMTNREMILTSLGFFKNDNKLDTFRSYFGYDWTDEDLNEAIEASGYDLTSVRNCLVEILWLKVVDEVEGNGSLDTHFYFKQTEVSDRQEIEELLSL